MAGFSTQGSLVSAQNASSSSTLCASPAFAFTTTSTNTTIITTFHLVVDSTLLLLVSQVYDEFVRLFAEKMNVTAGDPSLPTTKLGPLSSVEARNRLADQANAHA